MLVLLVLRILGFDGLFGQDSYEYLRFTKKMMDFLSSGKHPGDFIWPRGYPLVGAIFSFFLPSTFAMQLVSLFGLYGAFYYTQKLLKLINQENNEGVLYAFLGLLIAPYVLRNSIIIGSDTLAMCCFIGAVYYALSFKSNGKCYQLALSLFFGAFAVFTRYAAFVPVVVLMLFLSYYSLKKFKLSYLLALVAPVLLVFLHFYLELNNTAFSEHEWLTNWNIFHFYQNEFDVAGGWREYTFPNGIYCLFPLFYPGFFFLNLLLCFFLVRNKSSYPRTVLVILVSLVLSYAIFLAGIPFQNNRFLLLTYPAYLVVLYPGFSSFIESMKNHKYWIMGLLMLFQIGLFVRAFQPTYTRNMVEKSIVYQLEEYQNQTLYSFDMDVALMGRGLQFNYQSLWEKEYTTFTLGSLVLFNEVELSEPWEGKNPMLNWNKLTNSYKLQLIKKLPQGWKLYQINE